MRDDQVERLQKLSEALVDVVLKEADPATWPGAGKPLSDLGQQERGDRYWSKKNATASLALAMKVQSLIDQRERPDWKPSQGNDEDLEAELKAAEREASKRLGQLQHGRKARSTH